MSEKNRNDVEEKDDSDSSSSDLYTVQHSEFKPQMRNLKRAYADLEREKLVLDQNVKVLHDKMENAFDQIIELENKRQVWYRRKHREDDIENMIDAQVPVCVHKKADDLVQAAFQEYLVVLSIRFDCKWQVDYDKDKNKFAALQVDWDSYKVVEIDYPDEFPEAAKQTVQKECYSDLFMETIQLGKFRFEKNDKKKDVCIGTHDMYVYIPPKNN
jgi:hypothetical protein